MKLAMTINYSGDFKADVQRVQDLERAGLDLVWVPEAYSFDAISQVGFLAAKTSTINIGTGIINSYSRTATAVAQTAAGCDFVSDGRFVLGLGASGPQVIEGFHGVPYDHPMPRILDYINVCRLVWKREAPLEYDGQDRHVAAARRPGHRARQGAEDHQPPGAAEHPDLLGQRDGQERDRDGALRRRLAADLLRPDEVQGRVGRRDRRRARRARPRARADADVGGRRRRDR